MEQKKTLPSTVILLKRAWSFYKANFKKLWVLYLFGGLGICVSGRIFFSLNSVDFRPFVTFIGATNAMLLIVVAIVVYLGLFFSGMALFQAIVDIKNNQFEGIRASYKKSNVLFWPYFVIIVTVAIVNLGGACLFFIPGIALSYYLLFAPILLFTEQKKGYEALSRSWALVSGYWWPVFGRVLLFITSISVIWGVGMFTLIFILGTMSGLSSVFIGGAVSKIIFMMLFIGLTACTLGVIIVLYFPLNVLFIFELYKELKEIQATKPDVALNIVKRRKGILVGMSIFSLVVWIALTVITPYAIQKFVSFTSTLIVKEAHTGRFHSPIGGFSVNFIKQPTLVHTEYNDDAKNPNSGYLYESLVSKSYVLDATYFGYESTLVDATSTLQRMLKVATSDVKEGYSTSTLGTYHGHPSIDFAFTKDGEVVKGRFVLNERSLYGLAANYTDSPYTLDAYSTSADIFLNSLDLDTDNAATTSTTTILTDAYQISLPGDWYMSYDKATSTFTGVGDTSTFNRVHGDSNISVIVIDLAELSSASTTMSDDRLLHTIIKNTVGRILVSLENVGEGSFDPSRFKTTQVGNDTMYTYRDSVSSGPPKYVETDFEVAVVVHGKLAYEIVAIWPESEYGWAGTPIVQAIKSFNILDSR